MYTVAAQELAGDADQARVGGQLRERPVAAVDGEDRTDLAARRLADHRVLVGLAGPGEHPVQLLAQEADLIRRQQLVEMQVAVAVVVTQRAGLQRPGSALP